MAPSTGLGKRGLSPGGPGRSPKKQKGSPRKQGSGESRLEMLPQELRDLLYRCLSPSFLHLHVRAHLGLVFRDTYSTTIGGLANLRGTSQRFQDEIQQIMNEVRYLRYHEPDCLVVDMIFDELIRWRIVNHGFPPFRQYERLMKPRNRIRNTVVQERDDVLARFDRLRFIVPFIFKETDPVTGAAASLLSVAHLEIRFQNGSWELDSGFWRDIHDGGFHYTLREQCRAELVLQLHVRQQLGGTPLTQASLINLFNSFVGVMGVVATLPGRPGTGSFTEACAAIDAQTCPWNLPGQDWSAAARRLVTPEPIWWRMPNDRW